MKVYFTSSRTNNRITFFHYVNKSSIKGWRRVDSQWDYELLAFLKLHNNKEFNTIDDLLKAVYGKDPDRLKLMKILKQAKPKNKEA